MPVWRAAARMVSGLSWNRESGIGNRESGIGNRESGIGNRSISCNPENEKAPRRSVSRRFRFPIPHSRLPTSRATKDRRDSALTAPHALTASALGHDSSPASHRRPPAFIGPRRAMESCGVGAFSLNYGPRSTRGKSPYASDPPPVAPPSDATVLPHYHFSDNRAAEATHPKVSVRLRALHYENVRHSSALTRSMTTTVHRECHCVLQRTSRAATARDKHDCLPS
jgi:hypothetical protein